MARTLYDHLSSRGKDYLNEVHEHGIAPNESVGGRAGREGSNHRLQRLWSRLSAEDQSLIRRILAA